jgi:hypothetical protein
MNYLLETEDLVQVFSLVNNYLDPGGVFVFDMNTRYKYEQLLAENTFAENREEGSFIWENTYDPDSRINAYDLTLYIEETEGLYQRFQEEHLQRAYDLEEIQAALETAGMEFVQALDADTMDSLRETTERMYVIAKERGKNKNP